MRGLAGATALTALVLMGAIAGFFYAWSVSVIPGLDLATEEGAISAMQAINRAVRNPVFFVTFFLTPAVTVLAAMLAWRDGRRLAALFLASAAAVYVIGAMAPTVAVNVPMNAALAGLGAEAVAADAGTIWAEYSGRWTVWNHVRTAASALALLLVGAALLAWHGPAAEGVETASTNEETTQWV